MATPTTAEAWNDAHPDLGTRIVYTPVEPDAVGMHTYARSYAWDTKDGVPVIRIQGKGGYVPLAHIVEAWEVN